MAGDRGFDRLGATRIDLRKAADERLIDSEVLFQGGRYSAAVAMAVYSLEICLKVEICRRLDLESLPRLFEIHDLDGLLLLSGLRKKLHTDLRYRDVKVSWEIITRDIPGVDRLRYGSNPVWDETWATERLACLRGKPDGVIPWLRKHR